MTFLSLTVCYEIFDCFILHVNLRVLTRMRNCEGILFLGENFRVLLIDGGFFCDVCDIMLGFSLFL